MTTTFPRFTHDVGRGVVELLAPRQVGDGKHNSFVASTDTEARDGDIIDQSSWLLNDYRRNPVILDNHDLRSVVGRAVSVGVEGGQLLADVQWDTADVNPRGQLVAHQHAEGFRQAVSVRWTPGQVVKRNTLDQADPYYSEGKTVQTPWGDMPQVGRVMYDNTLLEISSVSVPADPTALQTRGLGLDPEQLAERMADVDAGAADAVLAALPLARLGSDELAAEVRDAILHLVRSDREVRVALRTLGLSGQSDTTHAPAHPLAGMFSR